MFSKNNFKPIVLIVGALIFLFQSTLSFAWWQGHHDHFYRYHEHPQPGMRTDWISGDYLPIWVNGEKYFYYDGLYYTPTANSYVIVEPPLGAVVPTIPPDYRSVMMNGATYYTDRGVYYAHIGRGYQVVSDPTIPSSVFMTERESDISDRRISRKTTIGIFLGALIGGVIGYQAKGDQEINGALIGGLAGAAAGGLIASRIPPRNTSRPNPEQQSYPIVVPASQYPEPVITQTQGSTDESFTVNIPNAQGHGYIPIVIKKSGNGFVGPQGEYYSEFPKVSQLQAMYSNLSK